MAWLRIDDGFTNHPKLLALSNDTSRWAWVRVMCWCARYRTDGHVPASALRLLGIRSQHMSEWIKIGLLEYDDDDELRIHDWRDYNSKAALDAERARRYRKRKRHAAERDDERDDVTSQNHDSVTQRHAIERDTDVTTRVDARARSRPVPNPNPSKAELQSFTEHSAVSEQHRDFTDEERLSSMLRDVE